MKLFNKVYLLAKKHSGMTPFSFFMLRKSIKLLLVLLAIITIYRCYSFSSFQTAKLLRRGQSSLTTGINQVSLIHDGKNDFAVGILDAEYRRGITDNFELGFKYSRIGTTHGYNFFSIGPKVPLIENRLAFSIPFGSFWGRSFALNLQTHPTLILSVPITKQTEIDLALKTLIFFPQKNGVLWALNFGTRFKSHELSKQTSQPEIGLLFDPRKKGYLLQLGWGISFSL